MFTGIVNRTAAIKNILDFPGKKCIKIALDDLSESLTLGDSVAVNGVCLTVVAIEKDIVSFEVVPQTLAVTNLGALKNAMLVNVELALNYGASMGGHMVQGHVDQTVPVLSIEDNGDAKAVRFALPEILKPYVIKKGFIAIDGMSITIQELEADSFSVALIPHTQAVTISKAYQVGCLVNIEVDMTAKYVQRYLEVANG